MQPDIAGKQTPPSWKSGKNVTCGRCGSSANHNRKTCPAFDAICRRCKSRGHYEAFCRNTKAVGVVCGEDEEEFEDTFFLGKISSEEDTNPWQSSLELNQTDILFKIDTGTDVTVISKEIYQQLERSPKLSASWKILYGPGQHPLKLLGTFTGTIQKDNKTTEEEVFIIQGARQALLGRPAIQALNLVSIIITKTKWTGLH